jgi:hypothetical protein
MEITLDLIATGIGIFIGFITIVGLLIHYDRKYTKLESRVEGLEKEINDLNPMKDTLTTLLILSKNPAIIDLVKQIQPPAKKRNPYDPAEKWRLLDKYQHNSLTLMEAQRLKEILNEDLRLAGENFAAALAVIIILIGLAALISSLLGDK